MGSKLDGLDYVDGYEVHRMFTGVNTPKLRRFRIINKPDENGVYSLHRTDGSIQTFNNPIISVAEFNEGEYINKFRNGQLNRLVKQPTSIRGIGISPLVWGFKI